MAIKLSYKLAGIFATGAFILVGLTTYAGSMDPSKLIMAMVSSIQYLIQYFAGNMESADVSHLDTSLSHPIKVLQWGIPGSFIGGVIGYFIGDIFAHPKGGQKKEATAPSELPSYDESLDPKGETLTGDESFLDDMDES